MLDVRTSITSRYFFATKKQ